MPKHDKIQNDELRGMMDQAYAHMRAGKVEIEFARERFAMSEAMTYYEFLSDTALAAERRSQGGAEAGTGTDGES